MRLFQFEIKIAFKLLGVLITLCCLACSDQGSGNIFDDPPDCYYDSVFGCGTFDIPGSSSYYGYRKFSRSAVTSSRNSTNSTPNFSGNWRGSLERKSTSCDFATPLKVHGNFSVKQLKNRVTIKLPVSVLNSYPLRGSASRKGLDASTVALVSFCRLSANSKLTSSNARDGNLDVNVRVSCPFQTSCAFSYSGSIKK